MTDPNFDPNNSFTDYKPQINVLPRISFSFPIADKSLFYAHYDVLVQRPKYNSPFFNEVYATPADYYFINQNSNGIIANPNLKPERFYDYELGFQQQVSNSSAITINGFYKERKDMIQVRPYLNAFPTTYYTYGNRDFSTTKGLILKYDLRRTNNVSMQFSYTLQFVEGSGSGSTSSSGSALSVSPNGLLQNFIAEGLPNLRFGFPLNNDSRHIFNLNIDYRFEDGEGPVVGKYHILENAGANFVVRARSGEPWTKFQFAGQNVVQGEVAGARLPWHYGVDFRVDKNWNVLMGKKNDNGARSKNLAMNAYVYITNVFNTREILSVNGFTGSVEGDGYLQSNRGIQQLSTITYKQSYTDLYNTYRYTSDGGGSRLNYPRQINIGVGVTF
jgi:outer membrane receptor protein involved in Fe transport